MAESDRRLLVATLLAQQRFGAASSEVVIRACGLGRVEGYAALKDLEERGLISRLSDGLCVSHYGESLARRG